MSTVGLTMMWDYLRQVSGRLLLAFLGTNLFTIILWGAAGWRPGYGYSQDDSVIGVFLTTTQFTIFVLVVPLLMVQAEPRHLYGLPIETRTIAFWRLVPAMALMAMAMLLCMAWQFLLTFGYLPITKSIEIVLNTQLQLNKGRSADQFAEGMLVGMPLFAAVAVAAAQAAIWLGHRSSWAIVMASGVAIVLGFWLRLHFGPLFVEPKNLWKEVTTFDLLMLVCFAGAAYLGAVIGMRRMRRGEPSLSLGIKNYFAALLPWRTAMTPSFQSSVAAGFWFEWRQKAWVMPTILLLGALYGLIYWAGSGRRFGDLVNGLFFTGWAMPIMGIMAGLVMGSSGMQSGRSELGSFLGTRPMTTATMARLTLAVAGLSTLIAWAIWAAGFLLAISMPIPLDPSQPALPRAGDLLFVLPATLLSGWTTMALASAIGLAGRQWLYTWLLAGLLVLVLLVAVFGRFGLPVHWHVPFGNLVASVAGIGGLALAVVLFIKAAMRGLVDRIGLWLAAVCWCLSTAYFAWPGGDWMDPVAYYVLIAGLCALVVTPLAAAPLALAWNRTR
jgi:hypothetical protein